MALDPERRRSIVRKIWLLIPVLLVAGACSKSSTPSTSPSEAPATSAPATSAAAASTTVKESNNATMGKILTNADGRTLYEFDLDSAGKSACNTGCSDTWPPLTFTGTGTPTGTSGLGTIMREDGKKQVTYNGKPLYIYSGDTKAGDTSGDGIGGKWHVAKVM